MHEIRKTFAFAGCCRGRGRGVGRETADETHNQEVKEEEEGDGNLS